MAPPLPALKLPLPPRRLGAGAIVAIAVHVIVIAAVLWERSSYLENALGNRGPRGGGGSGEADARYFALPSSPPAAPEVPLPAVTAQPRPIVEVRPLELPRIAIAPQPIAFNGPSMGSMNAGPGTGGGSGGGNGGGAGNQTGPGTGGDGGYIRPAVVMGLIVPPDCARGQFAVRFSVEVEGQVSRVDVDPMPKDAGCRREFLTRMREFKFKPALTVDGRPIASIYTVNISR